MLVIAFGNPLRQDDGASFAVAEALGHCPGVDVMRVHQLMPELAATLRDASRVVFVDARRDGPPGRIRREPVVASPSPWTSTHGLDPARLLGLCRTLYGRAPLACIVSIAGECFGFGNDLSERVRRAVPAAVRSVLLSREKTGSEQA